MRRIAARAGAARPRGHRWALPVPILLLLSVAPAGAQDPVVDVQAGVVFSPHGYGPGASVALSASPTATRRVQLRLEHHATGADEDSEYGTIVPDARRATTAALLLLQSSLRELGGGLSWAAFIGGGYGWMREEGTSILGGATVDRSDAGPAIGGGVKVGWRWAGAWRVELEAGLLAVYADPYQTEDGAAYYRPLRLGVVRFF